MGRRETRSVDHRLRLRNLFGIRNASGNPMYTLSAGPPPALSGGKPGLRTPAGGLPPAVPTYTGGDATLSTARRRNRGRRSTALCSEQTTPRTTPQRSRDGCNALRETKPPNGQISMPNCQSPHDPALPNHNRRLKQPKQNRRPATNRGLASQPPRAASQAVRGGNQSHPTGWATELNSTRAAPGARVPTCYHWPMLAAIGIA